ncbi:O-acetyl-ADP-ribose deacetylase [Alteromonas lipolytica]|uniref:O-acetyl-ADP-ribose deacetylase n=1 Tax=Alteromonas lipolytica TaxID=1856405 RepID=A0A1E8FIR4_9ALTE|nr:O-acetyl-ADP-ribose deacetylase [Alteromonas lipolytica]OFI35819.1 O-acetyl-ADP-ribose deacetylase [Alteromonas lipolytica]GGF81086.1 macro domain-containing protein [Alteromonas lipolytica]
MAIKFILGDITTAAVDAIVNAANPSLLGGGGVDGAIHHAAGPELLKACRSLPVTAGMRCPPGEARLTISGNLPCRYVIHTVGPVYHNDPSPAETLANAYRRSCELAISQGCRSIAFPAISCGVYGYPHDEAARIAVNTCNSFSSQLAISFYLFEQSLYACFVNQWQQTQAQQQ